MIKENGDFEEFVIVKGKGLDGGSANFSVPGRLEGPGRAARKAQEWLAKNCQGMDGGECPKTE